MDFLDPKKRKAHRIKLFIGYGLMAIVLMFASIILLYQSFGFDYDPETGGIVQNGMVFIAAQPDGADIYLNGEHKGRTDKRLDIKSGDYTLELQQKGYHSWKRDFTLEGGSIEQFVYPFLFPADIKSSDTHVYTANPEMVTQSLDRERVLIQQPGSFQSFDLIDISSDTAEITTINLPNGLLKTTGSLHKLETIEWSTDNKHVVLKHSFDAGQEFIVVNVEAPGESENITNKLATPFTSLTLKDKKYDQYYLYNETTKALLIGNLKSATASLYQADVLAYRSHGDDELVFITAAGASTGKVQVKIREGDNSYMVREIKAGSRYLVDLARFEDNWYVAAGVAEEEKVYLFKNPVATRKNSQDRSILPIAILRTPGQPEFISFSANTRFLASQSGNKFAVYDAETDRQYRYDSQLALPAGQKVVWMDGHRLSTVTDGKVVVWDYDGTNKQTLNAATAGYQPLFNQNYEALFTLSPSVKGDGRPALVRTELRVN